MNSEQLFHYILRLGDNTLLLGQQLGELVGSSPELEEEMATANFALDLIGQARLWLTLAGDIEGKGRGEDELAFLRDSRDFQNLLLVERPNGDFAVTIARQFLFSCYHMLLLEHLIESSDTRIQEIAAKAVKEMRYQVKHNRQWLLRLGDGTNESHTRMQTAIDDLWRFTGEMFTADDVESAANRAGVGPLPSELRPEWDKLVSDTLTEATLTRPEDGWMATGGKQGQHTEVHSFLLAEMQFLQRSYPGAAW